MNPSLAAYSLSPQYPATAALLVVLLAAATTADAQLLRDYKCVVERVVATAPASEKLHQGWYVGGEFTVDRRTGVMAGALKNLSPTRPIVLDFGSTKNSYKVITMQEQRDGPGHASLLVINEYTDTPKKPFLFADDDIAYFGSCAHF